MPGGEPAVAGGTLAEDVFLDDQTVELITSGFLWGGGQERGQVGQHHRAGHVRPADAGLEAKFRPQITQGAWAF